ncbi:MAG: mevalonate kinase [Bacteriovoracaceae bacterium]|nr:mevalonate kinase [Bacteriovoracaceae bacterium]
MAQVNSPKFFSKVLLFGEYSIIKGHTSLAIPYELFSGVLSLSGKPKHERDSHKELKTFLNYLKNLDKPTLKNLGLDLRSFEFDINHGLFFDSTIPQGHGVGSSGALCASLFERYSSKSFSRNEDLNLEEILVLKNHLAKMESHFHGASSGFDPLLSYLSVPLLTQSQTIIKVKLPEQGKSIRTLFLLDTERSRRTEPLVNLFLEKCKNKEFEDFFHTQYRQVNEGCIESFLSNNFYELYRQFAVLSDFQSKHFKPMIPPLYQKLWEAGLDSKRFFLKLCGAGGGGFLLGITDDFDSFCQEFPQEQVRVLFRFN